MKQDKFQNMENYTTIIKLFPEVYGFINVSALIGKNNAKSVYKLNRVMEYRSSYSPLRDRMFAGLTVIYNKMFELLQGKQLNNGNLKNYYLVSVETANDIPRRILSFDMFMIQADNFSALLDKPEFNNIPDINNTKKHIAIFAFGYQYEQDMNAIDIVNKVFHIKAFKESTSVIKVYNFEQDSDMVFDLESDKCKQFINQAFEGTDKYTYDIGLTMEDYQHDHQDHRENKEEAVANLETKFNIKDEVAENARESTEETIEPKSETKDATVMETNDTQIESTETIEKVNENKNE